MYIYKFNSCTDKQMHNEKLPHEKWMPTMWKARSHSVLDKVWPFHRNVQDVGSASTFSKAASILMCGCVCV